MTDPTDPTGPTDVIDESGAPTRAQLDRYQVPAARPRAPCPGDGGAGGDGMTGARRSADPDGRGPARLRPPARPRRARLGHGQAAPMPASLVLAPTADPLVFLHPDGRRLTPPADWACLPPGDAGLTRRVKAAGPSWQVIEPRGRKQFSRGLWAPRAHIDAARAALVAERATPSYARRRATDRDRRDRAHEAYVASFEREVREFLRFAPRWTALQDAAAALVRRRAPR